MTYEMRIKDTLAEGEAKGEAKEKLASAKRLLSMGLTTQDIAKATALPIEQIEKIEAEQA
jgi:predicted transposase/invertase (TIGR01784 family)